MGSRSSCPCPGEGLTDSIVPEQDPLTGSATQRIVRAELSRDFESTTQVLGTGYSGAVRMAVNATTRQVVAVKQFAKRKLKAHRLKLLKSEVEVYLRLDHPNICRLLHAYEGKRDVWLVMELCGCELYKRLCERKTYRERDAAYVMLQMLQAVGYLHSHNIVHRDLKLENWMYGATERDDRLKLIDFGFSRIIHYADETLDMPCGTLHYTSPEVLARKYTSKCDLWSLGVISYMLVIGRPPFKGQNNLKIAKAIVEGGFPKDSRWLALSAGAQDFICQLLQKDASKRLDARKALAHPWIQTAASGDGNAARQASCGAGGDIGTDVLKTLQLYARGPHLRRAAMQMMAYSLTSRELQDLDEFFLAFDNSGRGTINLTELAEVMHSRLEVSSLEVDRILKCLDSAKNEELHYTPFVAAMLATRVRLHEDRIRSAFRAFACDGSTYITADGLVSMYNELNRSTMGTAALSREDAERWIREVDYKGNGVIDYDGFLDALMGKKLWALPAIDAVGVQPKIHIFEQDGQAMCPRALSDSLLTDSSWHSPSSKIRNALASAIAHGNKGKRRSQIFLPRRGKDATVKVRNVSCELNERYFG